MQEKCTDSDKKVKTTEEDWKDKMGARLVRLFLVVVAAPLLFQGGVLTYA